MKLTITAAASFFLLFLATPASAQDCSNGGDSQVEMTFCAHEAWKQSDSELNFVRRKLQRQFGKGKYDRRRKKALLNSQRAWLEFRDADCEGVVGLDWEGGTGRPMAELICSQELTIARTNQLKDRYFNR